MSPEEAPVTWLVSSHGTDGRRGAADVELTLTESQVRALEGHYRGLGLAIDTINRPGGLSALCVTMPDGGTLNYSREWDADALRRALYWADATGADALRPSGGPTLAEQTLMDDVREIAEERDAARTEADQLRAELAALRSRPSRSRRLAAVA